MRTIGYFDHVPPFVAANPHRRESGFSSKGLDTGVDYVLQDQESREGVPPEDAGGAPVGMGYRVPMVIASPWTRGVGKFAKCLITLPTCSSLKSFRW